MESLHPVTGGVFDKDEHISVSEVHAYLAHGYAAQAIDPQAHVYRAVVEPVTVAVVKAEHWLQISVPKMGECHISLNVHRRAEGCP